PRPAPHRFSRRPAYVRHAARRPRCASARDQRILRQADQAVTMEIYANASSAATRDALRGLGDILPLRAAVRYGCTCSSTSPIQNPNMYLTRPSTRPEGIQIEPCTAAVNDSWLTRSPTAALRS